MAVIYPSINFDYVSDMKKIALSTNKRNNIGKSYN